MNFSHSLLAIFILLTTQISHAQIKPDTLEKKVNEIFQEYNTNKGPGCAVAIISNGKVIVQKGYGMANLEHDIPITTSTVFDIASVSKQFTGFAISSLIQEGKISDQDDIRKYLPLVPNFGKTITICHLIHHTSGLRDWPEALGLAGWRPDDVWSNEDILRMVEHQKELDFEPGTRYSYSNTGYNLLAAIVEKVSGKTFVQYINDNIFIKLKMESSIIPENQTTIIKYRASSYVWSENKYIQCSDLLTAYGSSSMYTSLNDMIKWGIYLDEQIKQKNAVFIRMLEPGRLNNGDTVYYGYGIGLSKAGENKRIAHTGGWSGFRSITVYYPDKHLSIIILSNSGDFAPRVYAEKVADLFFPREVIQKAITNDIKKAKDVKVNQQIEEQYTATYQLGVNWYITITRENDQLMCRSNGESKFPMIAKSDSSYWVDTYNNAITFLKDSSGYVLKYKTIIAKRIVPFSPDGIALKRYIGKYYSEELSTEYILTIKNGQLWLYHIRLGEIELFPEPSEETFGCSLGELKFLKDEKLEIIGFNLSGSRIKNIHFKKQ